MPELLSVIIPTLNEARRLPQVLAWLEEGRLALSVAEIGLEIVIADGVSDDDTRGEAEARSAVAVVAPRGRGTQLRAGAEAATGTWFLFLHADTRLGRGWTDAVRQFVRAGGAETRAGYFRFVLDDDNPKARQWERGVAWRSRVLGLPYGDQGLLISRSLYRRVGGFKPIQIMEDVDLIRRIGRRNLVALPVEAVTSAERFRADGYALRSARNLLCLSLWWLGVPPRALVGLYQGRAPVWLRGLPGGAVEPMTRVTARERREAARRAKGLPPLRAFRRDRPDRR